MPTGDIWFYVMLASGLLSSGMAVLLLKDSTDRKLPRSTVIIQAALLVWFILLVGIWVRTSKTGTSADAMFVLTGLVLGLLHCPVIVFFLAQAAFGAISGLTDPRSGIVLRKSYDEAEGAEADHDYEKALELYGAARERNPEDGEVRLRMGELFIKMGRFREAAAEFYSVVYIEGAPEGNVLHAALRASEIYGKDLKNMEAAKKVLRSALERTESEKAKNTLNSRLSACS